jgi:hypothetical protein
VTFRTRMTQSAPVSTLRAVRTRARDQGA